MCRISRARPRRASAADQRPAAYRGGTRLLHDNALGGYQDLLPATLELPLPAEHPPQQLDRRDLGALVALILADPGPFTGRRTELAAMPHVSPDMATTRDFLRGTEYHAHIPALHRDYPPVGWTSLTALTQRTCRTSDPAPQPDPS